MLYIERLAFSFPEMDFDFTLKVPSGERMVISGPSGTGKTTFLYLVAGLLEPLSGVLLWKGQNLRLLPCKERPIAFLPQSHHTFDHLDIRENIMLGRYSLSPSHHQNLDQMAENIIKDLDLPVGGSKNVAQLSGGQKQRVALGRLLLQGQPIWLMDEPFSGLDETTKHKVYDLLLKWQAKWNATIIFTSHHESEIRDFSTCHARMGIEGKRVIFT